MGLEENGKEDQLDRKVTNDGVDESERTNKNVECNSEKAEKLGRAHPQSNRIMNILR